MGDTRRMDIVVSGGTDPEHPVPEPRQRDPIRLLLQVIAAGVFLVVAGVGYVAWTVHQTQVDNRQLNCLFVGNFSSDGSTQDYNDLPKSQQRVVDRLDCDVPGR